MADVASSHSSSLPKKPSEMTLEEYVTLRSQYKTVNTVNDRDRVVKYNLAAMVEDVRSSDPDRQLDASDLFSSILDIRPDPPFQQVIQKNVVPRFVQFLDRDDFPLLQFEAVKILSIFAEESEHIKVIVDYGAVPKLVRLLRTPYGLIRKHVILTVGNIVEKFPEHREYVLQNQALEPLLAEFREDNSIDMVKIAVRALHQFCKGNPPLNSEMSSQVLPVLQKLLYIDYAQVLVNACWTLNYLSYGGIGWIQPNIWPDVRSKLLEMLKHCSPTVILPALETVANAVSGDKILAQCMIDVQKGKSQLMKLLKRRHYSDIRKAACRTVTNITYESHIHTQEVVSQGIVAELARLFESSGVDMKMEVARAMSNITYYGTPEDVRSVSDACVKPLCDMLDCPDDPNLPLKCLRGLDRILDLHRQQFNKRLPNHANCYIRKIEEANGLRKIIDHRYLGKDLVSGIAESILYAYWPEHCRNLIR